MMSPWKSTDTVIPLSQRCKMPSNRTSPMVWELGAAAAVTVDGELAVDIWAGAADAAGNPWQRDTIVNVYSTTKTMAAVCMLMLADRGELNFDAPVARYWPEFAQHGKGSVLVRHVMSHTAGLPGFVPPVLPPLLYDLDRVAAQLAGQQLWWEPGTKSGYHAITQGNLEGEILYRITGERMAEWFAREVADSLAADFWMSLPASEDDRVAELQLPPPPTAMEVNRCGGELRLNRDAHIDELSAERHRTSYPCVASGGDSSRGWLWQRPFHRSMIPFGAGQRRRSQRCAAVVGGWGSSRLLSNSPD